MTTCGRPTSWMPSGTITFGLVGGGAKIVVADTLDVSLDVQAFAAA